MKSDFILPKPGSYEGQHVVESLGNVTVFFRWDPKHNEASADFCIDSIYRASLRARIQNLQLRDARLRTVKSQVAIELKEVEIQFISKTVVHLVCSLPILPNLLRVELFYRSRYFRELEIVCYAPKGQLEGDLALRPLFPVIKNQLAHVGIKSLIRTGYPALPKDSPYGYEDLEYWEERELHELMESRSPAISTPRMWRLILLFVPHFDAGPLIENSVVRVKGADTKGCMFDRNRGNVAGVWHLAITSWIDSEAKTGLPESIFNQIRRISFPLRFPFYNDTVRQGAAIFFRCFQNKGETARTELLHTILHQIGHILNLHHEHTEESVMNNAPGPGAYTLNFLPHEIKEIRNGFFDDVAPGGYTEFHASEQGVKECLANDYSIVASTLMPNVRIGDKLDVIVKLKGKFDKENLNLRLLLRQLTKSTNDRFLEFIPPADSIVICEEGKHQLCLRIQGIDIKKLGFTTPGSYGVQAGAAHPNGCHYLFGQIYQTFNLISREALSIFDLTQKEHSKKDMPTKDQAYERPKLTGSVSLPLGRVSKIILPEEHKINQINTKDSGNNITFWRNRNQIRYSLEVSGVNYQGFFLPGTSEPILFEGRSGSGTVKGKLWLRLELDELDENFSMIRVIDAQLD